MPGINEPVQFVVSVILDHGSIDIGCFKIQSDGSDQVEFKASMQSSKCHSSLVLIVLFDWKIQIW